MTVCTKRSLLAATTLLSFAVLATAAPAEASNRKRLECDAAGSGDISMSARYEVKGSRKKFSVEMEAAPGGAFDEGQKIDFIVAGVTVASDKLEQLAGGGDLVGEINFDSRVANDDNPSGDEDPFPANFPKVSKKTLVQVATGGNVVLGCKLR